MAHQLDQNYNADLLDAMSDMAEEQYQAMIESSQSEWTMIEANEQFVGFTVTNTQDWEGVIHDDDQGS
jgi:excinuclease UvrABC ATPase subunit